MTHGTLIDYRTGDDIRPATREERMDSLHATLEDGGRGAFETQDGLVCYVECSGVSCNDDRFGRGSTPYDSPFDFQNMVSEEFSEEIDLIQDEAGWRDESGALVLVLA